jgi:N-acetylglucosaminyldiphosphoundecaprenol N-acetyl-beta-D-mannosaminyltransferase
LSRFSGPDYYLFNEQAIKFNWGIFFFGHDDITLRKIALKHPRLRITGYHSGYGFTDEDVIQGINESKPDILIVGLGFPKQEKWILKHLSNIECNAVIAVGDGIKVFAGTKIRGPKFMRSIGMEWFIRLLSNPFRYFKRYVIGNPLFLYRIIKLKIRKFG